ncbi:hypothetical protein BD626DRAFT_509307 [Schizophyllum amplum]|uniref:Uncharacterized protein n=1 Tax=Schizophyllum amplum TaxID=97359 RepID=A0A550C2X8_9AGAR|nr:hypothetical protein BD626DRAFT_509307 [Auriculariopsis ampla]
MTTSAMLYASPPTWMRAASTATWICYACYLCYCDDGTTGGGEGHTNYEEGWEGRNGPWLCLSPTHSFILAIVHDPL